MEQGEARRTRTRLARRGRPRGSDVRERTARLSTDDHAGERLLAAAERAAANLAEHVDEVDALNVFPVPDGDTGTNLLSTIRAAVEQASRIPPDERTLAHVAAALSLGALMGARGNSGVILSQILRGMAEEIRGQHSVDGRDLARSLSAGARAARGALSKPVEGTMLTVIRDTADAANQAAATRSELREVLDIAVRAAEWSVARTPELLPILREAGVVDSGGHGLALLLAGALDSFGAPADGDHGSVATRPRLAALVAHADEGYGYETIYLLTAEGGPLRPAEVREHLESIGESVVVAGDERMLKVHVHNERPDEVIAYGLSLGTLTQIAIENLDQSAHGMIDARARELAVAEAFEGPLEFHVPALELLGGPGAGADASPLAPSRPSASGLAVVAVAPGPGFRRILEAAGATVVEAPDDRRVAAGELVEAIRATGARRALCLPNDRNVQLAAEQALAMLPGIDVTVVPTRNAAEGVAALLALDPEADLEPAAAALGRAARGVRTLAIAPAVRDATVGGVAVRAGQVMALDPDDGLVAVADEAVEALIEAVRQGDAVELVTLYRGRDISDAEAAATAEAVEAALPGAEVEVVDGGQPHHRWLVAAE